MITEKIELLGKNVYTDIPGELTLKSIPTASELEYVSSEDFEATMLDKILPAAVEENINFRNLLQIDFQWICRGLRLLNYGPYHTTNAIYCRDCGKASYGEHQVDLRTIECKPLPKDFTVNEITIKKEEFIDVNNDVVLKLPTIQDMMNAYKDTAFASEDGSTNTELARICYMIKSIKGKTGLTPLEIKMTLLNTFSAADFIILKNKVAELTDYGLRAGGTAICPKCKSKEAAYIALVDDKFFRPTVGDLQQWRDDRIERSKADTAGTKKTTV